MYSVVYFVQMLLHFSYCTYKMDRMAEATAVAKDKIYIFCFCFVAHLLVRGPESETLPPSGIFADMYHFKASPKGI